MKGWMLVALALSTTATATASAATPDKSAAKQAYDRGVDAHKHGDMKRAAEEFAKADSLAPSATALQAALDATIQADDPALGLELLERAKREPAPPGLASSVTAAHVKFSNRAGRLRVHCPSVSACNAKIDDRPIEIDRVAFARLGPHTVVVNVDGELQTKAIEVTTEQMVEVSPSPKGAGANPTTQLSGVDTNTPPEPPPKDEHAGKLPRAVVFGGVGLTVLSAGLGIFFAVESSNTHDSFINAGCNQSASQECPGLKSDGETQDTLATVGLVTTFIFAAATAIIGIGFTDWKAPVMGNARGIGVVF